VDFQRPNEPSGVYYGLPESQANLFNYLENKSPLAVRAWVFQERLFAPRTLHFGPDQIAFECCSLRDSEGCESGFSWLDPPQWRDGSFHLHEGYQTLK
jgi:hypothetical protein